jgi:hypothetical protein
LVVVAPVELRHMAEAVAVVVVLVVCFTTVLKPLKHQMEVL